MTTCSFALADSRDSVTDRAVSSQTERDCSWSGSSETWGQYKHSLARHRQYHWKAKLLLCSQDFIGCHVDFACSGISIGLRVFLWLMVCVFRLWNQQPESPEQDCTSVFETRPPPNPPSQVVPLGLTTNAAPAHFSLFLFYIQPCAALLQQTPDLQCNLFASGHLCGHLSLWSKDMMQQSKRSQFEPLELANFSPNWPKGILSSSRANR